VREGLSVRLYAIIPTHNRQDELAELLATIPHYVEVLVVDNASEPPVLDRPALDQRTRGAAVVRDEEQPPNLSRLWNLGLQWAADRYREYYDRPNKLGLSDEYGVAVLNDDVLLSPGLLTTLAANLIRHDVDIAFPGPVGSKDFVNRELPFPGTALRMTGWCFMVRGSSGLRANENLRWWCGDDDLQAQAVTHGRGSVRVGLRDFEVAGLQHRYPDQSTTGALREQADADMKMFVAEWGQHPWLPGHLSARVSNPEDLDTLWPSASGDLTNNETSEEV
jgi:glycosyltransferase involved in cell wall biosynthesis